MVANTIPLAVITNLFRIIVTVGLTYYIGPVVLESVFHKLTGTFNFLLSFLLLIVLAELLRKKSAPAPLQPDNLNGLLIAYKTNVPTGSGWNVTVLSTLVIATTIWLSGLLESPSSPPDARKSG